MIIAMNILISCSSGSGDFAFSLEQLCSTLAQKKTKIAIFYTST